MSDNKLTTTAYAYCRVSSKGQVDGDGFNRQQQAIEAYAQKHGYQVKKVFAEDISGTTDEMNRPAFQEMITAILKNGTRTVIVERLDRLARQLRIQETILVYLASKGITLISASTEEDITAAILSDPMKKALVQIQGVFAELEKNLLVKKLKIARDHKREKTGKCEGRKSYEETMPEVVREIKRLRRKKAGRPAMTSGRIADYLNQAGHRTATGRDFNEQTIRNILR